MFSQVIKNKYNFYELKEKPSGEELELYYSKKYYQTSQSSYQKKYSDEEIIYIKNKIEQKYSIILDIFDLKENPCLLDIGSGEGWALSHFKNKSWDIFGLDYSDYGCKTHNPLCLKYLKVGDIYNTIDELIRENRKFDVIWLDNVLEHVIEPSVLVKKCKLLNKKGGGMVIEVPNDFSVIQRYLYDERYIAEPFWIENPDHISYFNKDGLTALCDDAGYRLKYFISDYPIDLNLFNQNTNYWRDKSKGKSCHNTRITIENLLHNISIEKTNELYRILAELGLGRQITGFFQNI